MSSEWFISPTTATVPYSMISSLREVSLPLTYGENLDVSFQVLSWIANIPTIEDVSLTHWHFYKESDEPVEWSMSHVEKLSVSGFGAAGPEVSTFINACTSLDSLTLWVTDGLTDNDPSFEDLLPLLRPISSSLTSLSLTSIDRNVSVGGSLANFPRLIHLELEGVIPLLEFGPALTRLGSLTHLALKELTEYDWAGLVPLLHGPERLPSLTNLGLGSVLGITGRRFDPSNPIHVLEFKIGTYDWRTWYSEAFGRRSMAQWKQRVQIARIARASGILVNTSFDKGIEIINAYLLESNNLAMAKAFYRGDLSGIHRARKLAKEFGLELPELDFENVRPNEEDSELVKVEMEGMGWFALTIRDK